MKGLTVIVKVIGTVLLLALAVSLGWTWYKVFILGNYWQVASIFLTIVVGLSPVYIAIALYYALKYLYKLKL